MIIKSMLTLDNFFPLGKSNSKAWECQHWSLRVEFSGGLLLLLLQWHAELPGMDTVNNGANLDVSKIKRNLGLAYNFNNEVVNSNIHQNVAFNTIIMSRYIWGKSARAQLLCSEAELRI
jgi:hypothetical protein